MSVHAGVVDHIAQLIGDAWIVSRLDEKTELTECGFDSVGYLNLLLRLEECFGKDLLGGDAPLPATVGDLVKAFEDCSANLSRRAC
jgi:acyl carrier protein